MGHKKLRDLDVVPIFFALEVVFDQDERLFRRTTHPIKFPVRAAFFDRRDFYFVDIETREVHPRSAKEQIGSHGVTCRCCDERPRLFGGCGQYNRTTHFGKQFVHPATKLCPPKSRPLRRGNLFQQPSIRVIARLDRRWRWRRPTQASPAFSGNAVSNVLQRPSDALRDTQSANQC